MDVEMVFPPQAQGLSALVIFPFLFQPSKTVAETHRQKTWTNAGPLARAIDEVFVLTSPNHGCGLSLRISS